MKILSSALPALLLNLSGSAAGFQCRTMVNLHGPAILSSSRMVSRRKGKTALQSTASDYNRIRTTGTANLPLEPPPNPSTLLTEEELVQKAAVLIQWLEGKRNVLCITGAGLSTESGLTDYRGHQGSYHQGHKPIIHDQFMNSEYQRKRYWGRGMVGWRHFDSAKPNTGHYALASLERNNVIGVTFDDRPEFYPNSEDWLFSSGQRTMTIITQNVDSLHRRAGSTHVTELHGRTDMLTCMSCGAKHNRQQFHDQLESINQQWLSDAMNRVNETEARPDGDAALQKDNYEDIVVPPCTQCEDGFLKPSVVFFGDNVPIHRVARCTAAVDAADGILVIGSSLAVYSAFRHVRAAHNKGIPIAILNVGETRAELEGLGVTKIEAPAGSTLSLVAQHFER